MSQQETAAGAGGPAQEQPAPRRLIRLEFAFGEFFPPEDPLARWVMAVSLVLSDWLALGRVAGRIAGHDEEVIGGDVLYLFRLSASHAWEARQLLLTGAKMPEVVALVERLPEPARAARSDFLQRLAPGGDVGQCVKRTRHLLFHYPDPTAPESDKKAWLQRAMRAVAGEDGHMTTGPKLKDVRLDYAGEVVLRGTLGQVNDQAAGQRRIENLMDEVTRARGELRDFANAAIEAYAADRRDLISIVSPDEATTGQSFAGEGA